MKNAETTITVELTGTVQATVVLPGQDADQTIERGDHTRIAEALLTGLDFNGMLAWIASGFVFDIMHAVGNFAAGLLIWPMSQLMLKLKRMYRL